MSDLKIDEYYDYYCKWASFGGFIAEVNELGLVHYDLSKDNIRITENGIVIMDCGDMPKIEYPKEWSEVSRSLMSLLEWIETDESAAFRFGYIQKAGIIGQLIFDNLREKYNYISLRDSDIEYNHFDEDSLLFYEIEEPCKQWIELRKKLKYGNIQNELQTTRIKQWRYQRDHLLMLDSDEKLMADLYCYRMHLLAALKYNSIGDIIEALLNLHGISIRYFNLIPATGYLYLCNMIYEKNHSILKGTNLEKYIENANQLAAEYYSDNVIEIERLKNVNNILHYIWLWDDLEEGTFQQMANFEMK